MPPSSATSPQPILILTTGGTIDKAYFDDLSRYQVAPSIVRKLLQAARVQHPFRILRVLRKDSLHLDDHDRLKIRARLINAQATRIIVTHGTDTMTLTARALSGIPGKTIVLTGALAPARFAESDAVFNLGMAFATAQIAEPGVYITMSGQVFPAHRVQKDRLHQRFVSI